MDANKLIGGLEAFLYEVFGLLVPGAYLAMLGFALIPNWNPSALRLEGVQWLFVFVVLYVTGLFLNGGRRLETKLFASLSSVFTRVAWKRRRKSADSEEPEPEASYPDKHVYSAARDAVASRLGLQADKLSGPETFNLCLAAAGDRASSYRSFVALRDMMRGLGFATSVALIMTVVRSLMASSPDMSPIVTLFAEHWTRHVRLSWVIISAVLTAFKWMLTERERRYDGISRRIIYPLALVAMKEASCARPMEAKNDER